MSHSDEFTRELFKQSVGCFDHRLSIEERTDSLFHAMFRQHDTVEIEDVSSSMRYIIRDALSDSIKRLCFAVVHYMYFSWSSIAFIRYYSASFYLVYDIDCAFGIVSGYNDEYRARSA